MSGERASLREALKLWARIGLLSFGGPAAQIALMHRTLVEEKKWLSEEQFLHGLNFCMLLPGPEAMQLATYAGWRLHGVAGGLAAGLLFVLPGAFVVLLLSMLYVAFGTFPWVSAVFFGIKAAVLAIVVEALLRIARRALRNYTDWWIASAAFIGLFVFGIPFPVIVLSAALVGFSRTVSSSGLVLPVQISLRSSLLTVGTWTALWFLPVVFLWMYFGGDHVFTTIAIFFSKLAMVTFGGAYAVLSYMAQDVVQARGWLAPGEMLDGLGLAETTPGPLILVIEYVAYLAGYRFAGGIWGGIAAAAISLWVTFVPCFLWIFTFAPYIDVVRSMPRLSGALAAITAAVVGVILNLSLWFGLHVLFEKVRHIVRPPFNIWLPDIGSLNIESLLLLAAAAVLLFRFRLGLASVLAVSGLAGLVLMLVL